MLSEEPTAQVAAVDPFVIESLLADSVRDRIESIEHEFETASTNRSLLEREPPAAGRARVLLAEFQTAGRGRRGRQWTMPAGAGLAMSLSWSFEVPPAGLSALSLAVGTAARRGILAHTGLDTGLKWPNDLMIDDGKLGGILVELDHVAGGICHVVIGIGLNVRMPEALLASVSDLPGGARDLTGAMPGREIERSSLAASLINEMILLLSDFAATGFGPYREEWLAAHVLNGREVEVSGGGEPIAGIARGVADDGALILELADGAAHRVIAGDVSIRALADVRH